MEREGYVSTAIPKFLGAVTGVSGLVSGEVPIAAVGVIIITSSLIVDRLDHEYGKHGDNNERKQ